MSKKEEFNKLKVSAEYGGVAGCACNNADVGADSGVERVADNVPFAKYPRPQLKRDSFLNLNGKWDCGAVVPFPLGSENCGAGTSQSASCQSGARDFSQNGSNFERYSYYTTFSIPDGFIKDRVLLNFGAVDQIATVFIDGKKVGEHEGGYTPFCFDITDSLSAENPHRIQVDVIDTLDHKYPYGKQKKARGGMWYTPFSGIWQTVWLESVPRRYIRGLKITPDLERIKLEIDEYSENPTVSTVGTASDTYTITVKLRTTDDVQASERVVDDVQTLTTSEKSLYIKIENPKLWSPEEPNLYDITIKTSHDTVQSYFGLRTVSIGRDRDGYPRLLLNGKPYFFNGVLDQGYWPEGIFLPNSEKGWESDILAMKKLGFNTLRKHIKVEPALFYEACDRLGMVVFQDFVNNADYSFFQDTILPTVFPRLCDKGFFKDKHYHKSNETRRIFKDTVIATIDCLYNFPCICYYTIFNEGWGQFCADELYDFVKAHESTRIIDSTSGWFKQKKTDVHSDHVYFRKIKVKKSDKPIVISEFGGYSFKLEPNHYFNKNQNYGYKTFVSQSELEKAIHELYDTQIKPYVTKGLCAAIYTQLSDVEDETNGFLTYDRIPKVESSFEVKIDI